jgi:tRNA dimethylallyltransferase
MTSKNLIYIAGPTGIGKTEISISLAKELNTEIISCDSRQFYKELKIGTSPPDDKQLEEVTHHFIYNKSIHDKYNVGKYEDDAIKKISELFTDKDYLILVGGSGLYADSIMYGIDKFPKVSKKVRNNIRNAYKEQGIEFLQIEIKKLDPEYYSKVDLNNHVRLLRALELMKSTGKSFSSMRSGKSKNRDFNTTIINLECSREYLYSRINNRVEEMLEKGLEDEVYNLRHFKDLNTMNTVGYKEFIDYFENIISYDVAVEKIKQNTRNYAKRQITWFKKYSNSQKINIETNQNINIKNLNL